MDSTDALSRLSLLLGERERAHLVVQLRLFFIYIYIYLYIYIRKYGSTFYIGIAMVVLPYFGPLEN